MTMEVKELLRQFEQLQGLGEVTYHFDKVTLITDRISLDKVRRIKRRLRKNVHSIKTKQQIDETTLLSVVVISKDGIRKLCTGLQGCFKHLECVEIAVDTEYYEDAQTADTYFPVGDELILRIGKYLTKEFGLDCMRKPASTPKGDKGIYTLYFNFTPTFKLVIYARLSKRKKIPVIHMEVRIFGYSNIKSKIGVRSLSSLRKLNVQNTFWQLYSDKISCTASEIDYIRVGNFFMEQHCNTKLIECRSIREVCRAKYKSRAYVERYGRQVCHVYGLETPLDVRNYCLSLKDSEYSIPQRLGNSPSIKNKNYFAVKI